MLKEKIPNLLNCPFCDEEPEITTWGRLVPYYKVLCGNLKCNANRDVLHKSMQEAADHWNSRI